MIWHTGNRVHVSVLLLIVVVLILPGMPAAQAPVPALEEIVAKLTDTNGSLLSFEVEQLIDVHVLVFRYRLFSTVYAARPARYRVVVHNPPWFLRSLGNVFVRAGRPEDVIKNYQPTTIAWTTERGQRKLYLSLTKRREEVNPRRVEAVVDTERWVVEKATLRYDWGDVLAEYQYGVFEGYLLPAAINLRVSNYSVRAALTYRHYRLNISIPDELFEPRN